MKKFSILILIGCLCHPLHSSSQTSWLLNGNIGTTGSNFIGTIDLNSLRFRVNNQKAVYIGIWNPGTGSSTGIP